MGAPPNMPLSWCDCAFYAPFAYRGVFGGIYKPCSRLAHIALSHKVMVLPAGLEPATIRLEGGYSNPVELRKHLVREAGIEPTHEFVLSEPPLPLGYPRVFGGDGGTRTHQGVLAKEACAPRRPRGAPGRIRTCDFSVRSGTLCPLRYGCR